jgi:hypothetical protein
MPSTENLVKTLGSATLSSTANVVIGGSVNTTLTSIGRRGGFFGGGFTSNAYFTSQGMATGNVVITCTLTKTLNAATSTNLLRRFQIDDELELLRLLDGQIYGLGPFENFIHVDSGAPVQVAQTHAVTHKRAGFHSSSAFVYRREPVLYREVYNLRSEITEGVVALKNPIRGIFAGCCASAMTATASSTTTTRIDGTAAFVIAHLVSSVMYHADRDKGKCDLHGVRQYTFVE